MNKLYEILRQWARRHDTPQKKLDDLTENIMARIETLPQPGEDRLGAEESRSPVFALSKISWGQLAVATGSVLLMMLIFFRHLLPQEQMVRPQPDQPRQTVQGQQWRQMAHLPEQVRNSNAKIYDEISRLFPGQVKWIKKTDGEIDFELMPPSTENESTNEYVMVRFVVMKKSAGADWQPQQVTDITAASEQIVQVPLDQQMGKMQFWVHKLPDGLFALDSEVLSARAGKGLATYGGVIRPGQSEVVFELEGQGAQYKIVQTIRKLCRINQKDCT